MSKKILLTGASGFIGTNLLEDLLAKGYEVKNLDWNEPKIPARKNLWEDVNIINYEDFEKAVVGFNPDYIVHLAARTDLDGKTLEDYDQNITGVENLMKIIHKLPNLKKIIITSSKFVTRNGYKIKNQHDYCPHTKYVTGALSGRHRFGDLGLGFLIEISLIWLCGGCISTLDISSAIRLMDILAMQFTRLSSFSLMKRKMRIIRFST